MNAGNQKNDPPGRTGPSLPLQRLAGMPRARLAVPVWAYRSALSLLMVLAAVLSVGPTDYVSVPGSQRSPDLGFHDRAPQVPPGVEVGGRRG